MKKKVTITCFILLIFISNIFPKNTGHFKGYLQLGKDPIVVTKDNFLKASNIHQTKPDLKTIRVLALVDSHFDSGVVAHYGWKYRSRISSDIVELEGPAKTAHYLTSLDGLLYAKMPSKVFPCMDSVRKLTHIDEVQGSLYSNLPQSYKGDGVLVGIIETEFDTHHPAFLDSLGSTRFLRIWDQSDSTGPISKFGYGTIKNHAQIDADPEFAKHGLEVHGTWVTGLAAGSVVGSNPYYGVAPKAALIGVKYSNADNDLVNGIKWIFSVADSLHMPCVINMSIGTQVGPHDGTSLIDKSIDNLSSNGKIIVGAAGNDGDNRAHICFKLNSKDTNGTWISPVRFEGAAGKIKSASGIDIWGKTGVYFSANFFVIDSSTMNYHQLRPTFVTSAKAKYTDTLYLTGSANGTIDTVEIFVLVEPKNALNNKVHVEALCVGSNPNMFLGVNVINSSSTADTIHAWNMYKKSFESLEMRGYSGGDSTMSINEVGGTAKRNITVGSYVSNLYMTLWDGTTSGTKNYPHELNLSSSRGPTVDGRIKPDITAPGCRIVCPLSSTGADENIIIWPDPKTKYGRYSFSEGTSFAAPIVTGIIALMLQIKPTLSPEEAKQILQKTSITDALTGTITTPNNYWGTGKVNALEAIQSLLGGTANRVSVPTANSEVAVSFLPNSIKFTGGTPSDFPCEAAWYSISGKLIKKQIVSRDKVFNYPETASSQVYVLKLQTQKAMKMMLLKRE